VSTTFVLLLAYAALQVALGLWIGRRVRRSEDFFVAGRALPAGLIFATFLAANIGAGSTVGAASLAYREGISAWWWNGSAGLGCLVLAFSVGPRLWRESVEHGDLTVGDFLERRYGRMLRGLTASLVWFGTLHILAAQLLGIASVLTAVAGLSPVAGCLVGAGIAATYFAAGGLVSTAWVNVLQLAVKLCGFLIVTPLALAAAGGWHALPSDGSRLDLFASTGPLSGWRLLFALGPAFIVSPGLIQKAYGARSARAVTVGVAANGAALLAFGTIPVILGSSARALFPSLASPDVSLATVAATAVPPAAGALALAAIFSAELSAADAVLLMLATSASRDLYRGFVNPAARPEQVLRVARVAAVAGAALGVALALVYQSIASVLGLFYALLTATLFVPVVGGVYISAAGKVEGLAAVVVGVATLAIVQLTTGGAGIGFVPPALAGVLSSAGVFVIVRWWVR